jgi:hypothetical protein
MMSFCIHGMSLCNYDKKPDTAKGESQLGQNARTPFHNDVRCRYGKNFKCLHSHD